MTIIKKNNSIASSQSNALIFSLLVVFLAFAVSAIFLYSQTVNSRHEINLIKVSLRSAEIENAELKKVLNEMTNSQKIQEAAARSNLVVEKNPYFIKNIQLVKN